MTQLAQTSMNHLAGNVKLAFRCIHRGIDRPKNVHDLKIKKLGIKE